MAHKLNKLHLKNLGVVARPSRNTKYLNKKITEDIKKKMMDGKP